MPLGYKLGRIVDLNLFSGSSDTMRTALGGFFDTNLVSDLAVEGQLVFDEFTATSLKSPYLLAAARSTSDAVPFSTTTILPNYQFPIRITADPWILSDDNMWETLLMGGTFGESNFEAIYNDSVWDNYEFEVRLPYSQMETNTLVEGSEVENIASISSMYNYYLPEYQQYVADLDSELLIPNLYLIEMFNAVTIGDATDPEGLWTEYISVSSRVFDQTIQSFVSLDDTYSTVDESGMEGGINLLLSDAATEWGEQIPNYMLHSYLAQSVPLTPLSASTKDYVKNALQNIYFDQYADGTFNTTKTIMGFNATETETIKNLFPYYVNVSWDPVQTDAGMYTFRYHGIMGSKFSPKFIKTLKEVFSDEAASLKPSLDEYAFSLDYQTSSIDSAMDDQVITVNNTTYRTVNYLQLLHYAYQNYTSTTTNGYFAGETTIHRVAADDTTGTFRYVNSKAAMEAIEHALDFVNTYTVPNIDSLAELYNHTNGGAKQTETLAYRIEKVGGPPVGDSQTQNVLQNFWIFNDYYLDNGSTETVSFYDTQVKYDEEYTYNIYAYILVLGFQYKTSDLRISRQIGTSGGDYCLEFFDPVTGLAADPLYEETTDDYGIEDYPYHADFYVKVEPSLKIFEVPIASKTLKVMDNPASALSINPFQLLDESQTIGYTLDYEPFVKREYPKVISSTDDSVKEAYLNSKDLIESSEIIESSISRQRFLEVYRLSEKPEAYTDFDTHLLSTIDLKLENSTYTLSNTIFYDIIKTNQTYYYVFRVLNENQIPGPLSEIYEAELINDGGYTYSAFDILFEEDLQEGIFVNPSLPFKKLIQLQPNMSQISLNDELVDYTADAASQLENMALGTADDLIWNKTFKIRLTSKKTGKKLDLNVTYKYERDSN